MEKRHSIVISLMLLTSLTISYLFQTAVAAQEKPTFPKTYEIADSDVERYSEIMEKAINTAPPLVHILHPTIE